MKNGNLKKDRAQIAFAAEFGSLLFMAKSRLDVTQTLSLPNALNTWRRSQHQTPNLTRICKLNHARRFTRQNFPLANVFKPAPQLLLQELKMKEEIETTAFYLRCRINDALMGRKTALKFGCDISYRQATNRIRKARRALRRHNSRMVWL